SGSRIIQGSVAITNDFRGYSMGGPFPNIGVSGFTIVDTSLPTSAIVGGSAQIPGTIPLLPGRTAAVQIAIALLVGIQEGDLTIQPGPTSMIALETPDAPGDFGKIGYRRDQPFWVDAVAQMLGS